MWPGLVANKLLRKEFGNENFVADFAIPSASFEENSKEASPNLHNGFPHQDAYKLFVSSWNVGGVAPPEHLDVDDWLDAGNHSVDIYVLGFQEIVPLKAGNILGPENKRISSQWNSLIRASLNKTLPKQGVKVEKFQESCSPEENNYVTPKSSREFQCIISKQMVGLLITVWVRSDLCQYIQHPNVSCVGCGIMGCLGNKGSVSVRFCVHETSFCFVCSHLASGGKEGDEKHRNADAAEILRQTRFPHGHFHNLPRKILDHE